MSTTGIVICTAGGSFLRRRIFDCPVCGVADSCIVVNEPGSPYYGSIQTCTNCGDQWSDGELWGRPFRRGWRQEAIDRAVAEWDVACTCPVDRDDDLFVIPCEHYEAAR